MSELRAGGSVLDADDCAVNGYSQLRYSTSFNAFSNRFLDSLLDVAFEARPLHHELGQPPLPSPSTQTELPLELIVTTIPPVDEFPVFEIVLPRSGLTSSRLSCSIVFQ